MNYLTLAFLIVPFYLHSQSTFVLNPKESALKILGTSTLHDWESVVETYDTTVLVEADTLKKFNLLLEVRSIKSGKESMDENTWEALKAETHPRIEFTSLQILTTQADSLQKLTAIGNLTIAGKTKKLSINGQLVKKNGGYLLSGEKNLEMTDFNIEPPTMFFGTVKTGNKIKIQFKLFFNTKE